MASLALVLGDVKKQKSSRHKFSNGEKLKKILDVWNIKKILVKYLESNIKEKET